jgi:hypothetical protein
MQQIEFIFLRYFALHVSGATLTHHQEPQLYKRVWCNCINRLCDWAKCVPDPDQLYGRSEGHWGESWVYSNKSSIFRLSGYGLRDWTENAFALFSDIRGLNNGTR